MKATFEVIFLVFIVFYLINVVVGFIRCCLQVKSQFGLRLYYWSSFLQIPVFGVVIYATIETFNHYGTTCFCEESFHEHSDGTSDDDNLCMDKTRYRVWAYMITENIIYGLTFVLMIFYFIRRHKER